MTRQLAKAALLVLVISSLTSAAVADDKPDAVWIYRDYPQEGKPGHRSDVERMFAPFGLMPGSRTNQITVDQQMLIDENDESKGTCIEYFFEFKRRDDWVGAYTLIGGNSWGTKPGINVQELLDVKPNTQLALRFKAKGEGAVSFKIGGVRDGEHKSSLVFARETRSSPVKLTKVFTEYTVGPIAAGQLTNLIDPFCVVTSGVDNVGRDSVRVLVDDIRLERFDRGQHTTTLPKGWRERLSQTLFVSYTPTGFDPTAKPIKRPTTEDIKADLQAIRKLADSAGIEGNSAGIVTYGCRDGLEMIPSLARDADLSVILGIFNPRDEVEVDNAARLLEDNRLRDTITACCIGNEAITFRRASFEDIRSVAAHLRSTSAVPLTTTEVVQAYGDKRLFTFDFSLVNAHGIFSDVYEPKRGAQWAVNRIRDLLQTAPSDHLILMKELGWPAGPKPHFDDEQQELYWKRVFGDDAVRKVNVCIFDTLNNVAWKMEEVSLPGGDKANIGPHWPVLFDADRKPTNFAVELLSLWKKSRPPKREVGAGK